MFIKRMFFLCVLYSLLISSIVHAYDINARSVIVVDTRTDNILFAKDPDLKLPPASTLKLMTAIVAVEESSLNDIATVSKKASSQQPSSIELKEGERIKIEDLLYACLMESANDAAVAIAEAVAGNEWRFVELMNQKALKIGATDTRFVNANGLPANGQYTTARDLAKIMRYAINIPIIREILSTRLKMITTLDGREIFLKNTNKLLWMNDNFLGGKTGYTRAARHCFVGMAMNGDSGLIISILGSPSRNDLWSSAEALLEKGIRVLSDEEEPTIIKTASKPKPPSIKKKRFAFRYKKKMRS